MIKNKYFENQTSKILCGDTELMINSYFYGYFVILAK